MRKVFLAMLLAVALTLSAFSSTATLKAQQITPPGPQGQFLEITPVKRDVAVERGTVYRQDVEITNRNVSSVDLDVSFDNFVNADDEGNVRITDEPTPYDLKRFVTYEPRVLVLAPRETRKVAVAVTIPQNVSPGGYYGLLRFKPAQRTDFPPVAITGQIGSLFLVRVPGPTREGGEISHFQARRADGKKIGWFFLGDNLWLVTKVKNTGNVHFSTAPQFEARDQFGRVGFKQQLGSENVFPQAERKFESEWQRTRTGWYTAKVSTGVPGTNQAERTIRFLVVTPLFAAIALLILVVGMVLLIIWRRRRAKHLQA